MAKQEADIFSYYLIGEYPSKELTARYSAAAEKLTSDNEREVRIAAFAGRHPFFLPFLDAALAVENRNCLLRKKLLVMLAILETTPEYYSFFASKDESRLKWIGIFLRGCSAVFKMVVGKLILLFF